MAPQAAGPGPRARYREQTRAEIKDAALRQLAEGGTPALALVKIAKELGLSGPALYRYFAGRDDLLDALIGDAYADLAAAMAAVPSAAEAGEAVAGPAADSPAGAAAGSPAASARSPRAQLRALVGAFRAWAVEQPHRYLLIAGTPVPGYEAPQETRAHARAALGPLVAALTDAAPGPVLDPVVADMRAWIDDEPSVVAWLDAYVPDADPRAAAVALAGAVHVWSQLHGTVSLEVSGLFQGMGHDPATLLAAQADLLADALGLP